MTESIRDCINPTLTRKYRRKRAAQSESEMEDNLVSEVQLSSNNAVGFDLVQFGSQNLEAVFPNRAISEKPD